MLLITSLLFCFVSRQLGVMYLVLRVAGYVIDVRRKTIEPEKNPARLLLFFLFFPAVPMGPVTRYAELSETLYAKHSFDFNRIMRGCTRALFGCFKKLVIADRLAIAVRALSASPDTCKGAFVLLLMVFYTTQLYADFTGGMDIALGVSQIIGVRLPENFNRPYSAKTLAEFWQRWHITLGTWFRDYVFYPLSTSTSLAVVTRMLRASEKEHMTPFRRWLSTRIPVFIPTLVVWFFTGLWHGFGLHFVVWGLLNGLIILISREWSLRRNNKAANAFPGGKTSPQDASAPGDFLRVFRTLFIVASLRLLDCYESVPLAFAQFASIASPMDWTAFFTNGLSAIGLSRADYVICALGVLAVYLVSKNGGMTDDENAAGAKGDFRTRIMRTPYAVRAALFGALLLITLVFGVYGPGYDATTFLYARF